MSSPLFDLLLYSGSILLASVLGGALPLLVRWSRERLQWGLSFSAGAMLGAAFIHMLPEAFQVSGIWVSGLVLAGFLSLYLLERFIAVHACEVGDCEVHAVGLKAFFGLAVHALTEGVALGAALEEPGLAFLVFLAVLAHKTPSSFALALILIHEGYSRVRVLWMSGGFIVFLPLGGLLYLALGQALGGSAFRGAALAFAGGTFLHISLTDILPEVHRQSRNRLLPAAFVLLGAGVMFLSTLFD
jgi:zinc and cadmium transporter